MRIAELLQSMASWLEDPNNEALLLSEYDDNCLEVVAGYCVEAANILKKAAVEVDKIEPEEPSKIDSESVSELAALASVLDETGDEKLMKQAAVIDELLTTICAPQHYLAYKKLANEEKIEKIKKNRNKSNDEKVADALKAIEKSKVLESPVKSTLELPLSTRYCPDHPGTPIYKIEENKWQCILDKKTYDFANGYSLEDGTKVHGGAVENQTSGLEIETTSLFDSRADRMQFNQ